MIRRSRFVGTALICVLFLGACADEEPVKPAATASPEPSPNPVEPGELEGEWQRETTCQEMLQALTQAGLEDLAPQTIAGNGLVRGTSEKLANKPNICEGAIPRMHSHFFTADGVFGSLNWLGQQVDENAYEVFDDHTFTFGGSVTFRYRIRGDTITFDPVVPADCTDDDCREAAAYAVSVAFPGHEWDRVA